MAGRKIRGKNCLLYLFGDGEPTPLAGHNGDLTLDLSADTVETTVRGPGRFKEYDSTLMEYSLSAGGFYIPGNEEWRKLRNAFLSGERLPFELSLDGAERYRGEVIVTSFPIDAAITEFVQVSMDLQGTGELVVLDGASGVQPFSSANIDMSAALRGLAGNQVSQHEAD